MLRSLLAIAYGQLLSQADGPAPVLMRMDREDRIRVFLALAAILLLGFIMIFLAWWGARWTRRYANRPARKNETPFSTLSPEDWASKRLHDSPDGESPADED